jgi:hypothetical protein
MRIRGGHAKECVIALIDPITASSCLRIAPFLLEAGARHRLIPHYKISGQIRFDPIELDRWVKRHKIEEIGVEEEID